MICPEYSREQAGERAAAISTANPMYGPTAQLLAGLLERVLEHQAQEAPRVPAIDQAEAEASLARGLSLWRPDTIHLDMEICRGLFRQLLGFTGQAGMDPQQARPFLAMQQTPPPEESLLRAALGADTEKLAVAAEKHGARPDSLALFLRLSAKPSLFAASRLAAGLAGAGQWEAGHCPVCGSPPGLSSLAAGEGGRLLHCSLCESAWSFPRIKCPFCGTEKAGDLGYLKPEGEEGYIVDLCGRCGRHLKCLDLRALAGPVILLLDDLATLHLDAAAARETPGG